MDGKNSSNKAHAVKINGYKFFKLETLLKKKIKNKQNIILCFPAVKTEEPKVLLNEISIAKKLLKKGFLDIVAVAYDGKKDDPIPKMVAKEGISVVLTRDIKTRDMKSGILGTRGKGTNMRKFAYFAINSFFKGRLQNNLVGFLDADIKKEAFGEHYILGLFGPLISRPSKTRLVKLVYRRLKGYGRVNKLLCHPLMSVLDHPKLKALQFIPYITSGEVAMDGKLLTELKFSTGYSMEVYTLMQFVLDKRFGPSKLELTNVGFFDHKHQNVDKLTFMSFSILRVFFRTLKEYGLLKLDNGASISNIYRGAGVRPPGYQIVYTYKKLDNKTYQPLSEII